MLAMLKNYFLITFKVLKRRKFYTFISLFGIAFTLVVLITAVAIYENSYHPHRPESRSDRFLTFSNARFTDSRRAGYEWNSPMGYKFLDQYARRLPHLENFSIHSTPTKVVAFSEGRKIELMFKYTDGAFWEIMDFQFVEGGPFTEADHQSRRALAVINEATRDQYFGDTNVVGKEVRVDGKTYRVIGVVKNVPEYRAYPYSDIWVPIMTQSAETYRTKLLGDYYGTALVQSTSYIPAIKAELKNLVAEVESPNPEEYDTYLTFADTHLEAWAREWGPYATRWEENAGLPKVLGLAFLLALLFMLLPALNIINLNISRIMERTSEIGVRKAFGATSATLTLQFLVENILITLVGGLLGLIGTWCVLTLINRSDFIPYAQLSLNFPTFLATLGIACLFGLLSGVYPAWRMSKTHPATALKGGTR